MAVTSDAETSVVISGMARQARNAIAAGATASDVWKTKLDTSPIRPSARQVADVPTVVPKGG